jgi:hypothetical protein
MSFKYTSVTTEKHNSSSNDIDNSCKNCNNHNNDNDINTNKMNDTQKLKN